MDGILLFLRLIPFSRFAGLLMILVQNTPFVVSIKGKNSEKKSGKAQKTFPRAAGAAIAFCRTPDDSSVNYSLISKLLAFHAEPPGSCPVQRIHESLILFLYMVTAESYCLEFSSNSVSSFSSRVNCSRLSANFLTLAKNCWLCICAAGISICTPFFRYT